MLTITDTHTPPARGKKPLHPGEMLDHFLEEMDITAYALAKNTGMTQTRIGQILKGKRGVTAETALRLGLFFGNTPGFWLTLQQQYDVDVLERQHGAQLRQAVIPWRA